MAHSPDHYRELGRLVARSKEIPAPELYELYQSRLMEALRLKATPRKTPMSCSTLWVISRKT